MMIDVTAGDLATGSFHFLTLEMSRTSLLAAYVHNPWRGKTVPHGLQRKLALSN